MIITAEQAVKNAIILCIGKAPQVQYELLEIAMRDFAEEHRKETWLKAAEVFNSDETEAWIKQYYFEYKQNNPVI